MNTSQSGRSGSANVRLSEYLPKGAQAHLAEKHGFSQPYVSLVLKGERKNETILLDALDMAEKEKVRRAAARVIEEKKQKEIDERIAQLSA